MAVPWLKIIQWMPSLLDVSRELLRKTQNANPPSAAANAPDRLIARILVLEENERRQAELIARMAEQLGQLADAVTYLHRRVQVLIAVSGITAAMAVAALVVALYRGNL